MSDIASPRPHYFKRLWAEFNSLGGEQDRFVKLIIVERLAKATILIALAIGLIVAGDKHWLTQWAQSARDQLNLDSDANIVEQLFYRGLVFIGSFSHTTLVAIAAIAYAALEATEGVGLAMRRRWAEYLTVLATAAFIPFEAYEVIHRATLFRVGALLFNLAVVGYLVYRKRLFVNV
jgi:uncharacterized membrane protein (DUF2068 family)